MEAQILDADCVQVGTSDPTWTHKFRSNNVSYLQHPGIQEYPRKSLVKGLVFAVRLWCRTIDGRSLCVVVANPWSTSYRKLKQTTQRATMEDVAQRLQYELNAFSRSGGNEDANVKVVYKKNDLRISPRSLESSGRSLALVSN